MNIAETDSEQNHDRSNQRQLEDQKIFGIPDLDLLNDFDDNDSEDAFGLIHVEAVEKLEQADELDQLDSLSLLHADEEKLDLMQPACVQPNDDENDLVDDGFFDNLVNGSGF